MNKLKPCPFCGEAKLLELRVVERVDRPKCNWTATVTCLRCFSRATTHGFEWAKEDAEQKAITAWNTRTEDKQ